MTDDHDISDAVCAGTMLSGLSAFCCGKSRMHSRENKLMSVCCVNCMVGIMQFFTVTFLLVGWAWSLVWGIYMVILAGKKSFLLFLIFSISFIKYRWLCYVDCPQYSIRLEAHADFGRSIISAELWTPEIARRKYFFENFLRFLEKRTVAVKFSKFIFERFHRLNDRRVVLKFREKQTGIGN